jgi:hypothetical protein
MVYRTRKRGKIVEVPPLLYISPRASLLLPKLACATSSASESQDTSYD